MMRKDVRIGFAIGGVLLAVLIVYGLVTSGPNPRDNEVTLAPDDPGAASKSTNGQKPAPVNGANGAAAPQAGETSGGSDPITSGTAERKANDGGAGALASNPQTKPPTTAPADKWEQALTTGALPTLMAIPKTETPSPAVANATPAPGAAAPQQPEQPLAGNGANMNAGATNSTPGAGAATPADGTTGGNSGGAFDARVLTGMATEGATTAPPPPPPPTGASTGATPGPGMRTHTVQPNE